MSLTILKRGLAKAKTECSRTRTAAISRMGFHQFLEIEKKTRKEIQILWAKETKRLSEKEFHLTKKDSTCGRHLLCQWIRRDCKRWTEDEKRLDREPIDDKVTTDESKVDTGNEKVTDINGEDNDNN